MKKLSYDLDDALGIMLDKCECLDMECLPIEKVGGKVLSADVFARHDIPMFDKSLFDGFAVRASDTRSASGKQTLEMPVVGEIPAGSFSHIPLKEGCVVKILTGAPLPEGADAVVKFEDVEFSDESVTLSRHCSPEQGVIRRGADVASGELIATQGSVVNPTLHAMLASQGMGFVDVYKTPFVGILSQGSELVRPGLSLSEGKIYNSNRYMLDSALKKEGFSSIPMGIVPDVPDKITKCLSEAVNMYDVVIMTGGAAGGTYDYTKEALEQAGAEIFVERINLRPGNFCCLATLSGIPIFGLSGNPTAAMTVFYLITVPVLRKLSGRTEHGLRKVTVRLARGYKRENQTARVLKGHLSLKEGNAYFHLDGDEYCGTGVECCPEAFVIIPAESQPLKAGSKVQAYLI